MCSEQHFIDRDQEINSLMNSIYDQRAKIDIIYARSGVGKTSLVKKLMYRLGEQNTSNVIFVKTLPINTFTTSNEWLYIDLIFDTFLKYFEESSRWSFQYFLSSGKSDIIIKQMYERNLEQAYNITSIKQLLWHSTISFVAQTQNLFQLNPYKVSTDNSLLSRKIKAQYIGYILKSQRIIFIMDNIQNIDGTSLKFLLDWINETKSSNHYFLFQYTITETKGLHELSDLKELFSDTGMFVKCTELSNMSSNYVADIIENQIDGKPTSIRFNIDALQHYEKHSNGNIRELLDFVRRYENEKDEACNKYSSTTCLINALSPEAKSILAILIFSNGEIQEQTLFDIWVKYFDGGAITPLLQELENASIISHGKDSVISVAHGYIIDEWNQNLKLFSGIDRMVYNRLVVIYNHILQNPSDYRDSNFDNYKAWQFLLQMYAKREPNKISMLLKYLEDGLICDVSSKNVWYYINLLIQCTEEEIDKYKSVYYKILNLCYKLDLFQEGMKCLEKMEQVLLLKDNHLLVLYKINYLTGLDRFNEAINLYKWALGFITQADSIWFHLHLCILCSYRSLNQIAECEKIGKRIKMLKKMRERPEYAFYLRLLNIYLPNSAAIKYAKRSAEWFTQHNDNYQAGKSYITYSKLLASVGNYKKAIWYSEIAQSMLAGHEETLYFLYSNLAAYKLLDGEYGEDIWNLLGQAELSASVPYSRLAIIVNKLAWCCENQAFERLDLLINTAKKLLPLEPDQHIHALYYYNMYLIAKMQNNEALSNNYLSKASALQDKCRFIAARISGDGKYRREIRCRLRKPWHVCFLSFWTYDLPLFNG